jgi:hypothetical protein
MRVVTTRVAVTRDQTEVPDASPEAARSTAQAAGGGDEPRDDILRGLRTSGTIPGTVANLLAPPPCSFAGDPRCPDAGAADAGPTDAGPADAGSSMDADAITNDAGPDGGA